MDGGWVRAGARARVRGRLQGAWFSRGFSIDFLRVSSLRPLLRIVMASDCEALDGARPMRRLGRLCLFDHGGAAIMTTIGDVH